MGQIGPGRPPEVTEKRILDIFAERDDQAEPMTTNEIAEHFDQSRRAVYDKLEKMSRDEDGIRTKKVGANGRAWWIPIQETADQSDSNRLSAVAKTQTVTIKSAEREALHATLSVDLIRALSAALLDRQAQIRKRIENNPPTETVDIRKIRPQVTGHYIRGALLQTLFHGSRAADDPQEQVTISHLYRRGDEAVFLADLRDIIQASDLEDDDIPESLQLDLDEIQGEDPETVILRAAYEAYHGRFDDRFRRANHFSP